jgi:hypothetical protein
MKFLCSHLCGHVQNWSLPTCQISICLWWASALAKLSFIKIATFNFLDHSQFLSNEAMCIATVLLGKTSTEDRWQQDDSCEVGRWGGKTTSTQHAGKMLQVLTEAELHTSWHKMKFRETAVDKLSQATVLTNGWVMWSWTISYPLERREVTRHKNISFLSKWRFDIDEVCKGNQWSSKHIYANEPHWYTFF